jgi:hypothetical protein
MIEPLIRGICPICSKKIMDEQMTKYINGGMEFYCLLSDNTKIAFASCEDCFSKLDIDQVKDIMKRNIVSWGIEIANQLKWYYSTAIHLTAIKFSKDKDGLTA